MTELTALGGLLESARKRKGLSARAAAKAANISEGRWRQIVTGTQKSGEIRIPVNPKPDTVARMADAVGVSRRQALLAADLQDSPDFLSLVGGGDHAGSTGSRGDLGMDERQDVVTAVSRAADSMTEAVAELRALVTRIASKEGEASED